MNPLEYSRDRRTARLVLSASLAGAIAVGGLVLAIALAAGGLL